jgi:hypothetical protein
MAKRKNIDAVSPEGAPETSPPQNEPIKIEPASLAASSELPTLESPSISPATPVIEPDAEITPVSEPEVLAKPITVSEVLAAAPAEMTAKPDPIIIAARPRFALRPRHKRYAMLAASVAIAAVMGAVVGVATRDGLRAPPPPPRVDVAGIEERKALQQSVGRLAKEVTTLKASLDAANKVAHSQIAKITERFDRAASAEITGSISAPQTTAAALQPATPAANQTLVPLPQPRMAAVETKPPALARPSVVQGWEIRDARDGYVYVQGHGDIYQVVPGAPLPGLGPVESVKRTDGRWVVTTRKGIIVSMRDRRYFESF